MSMDGQDAVFKALGDPTRRAILDRLFERDGQSLGELERRFAMTRFGVMKHLRVLEEAGLVTARRVGRAKLHYLNPVPIREIADRWVGKFAEATTAALLALRSSLEEERTMGTDRIDAGAKPSHVFTIFIRATADRIWDAITRSEFTTRYYYASTVDSDWRPGSSVVYAIEGQPMILGEVIESEPPRKLVTTFDARWGEDVAGDPPTRISWEIADAGPGVCQLTVVHDGFDGQTATYREIGGGMPLILSGLKTLLETGQPMMTAGEPEHANA